MTTVKPVLALAAGLSILLPAVRAETAARDNPRSMAGALIDDLDDGPHVYWRTPTSAVVFHLCDRLLHEMWYDATDTLRFNGLCADSAQEYVIPVQPPDIEPHLYDGVTKMFAVSDIHGEFEPFVDLLQAAGIIDEDLHWSWGDGHFVLNGDIFDRGAYVTECLWLLYRLEQEARQAGGRVHVLLGNHETMVLLQRDLRYVNEKYTNGIVVAARVNYTDLFGPDMELGRWLRTKHTAIRLNDVLFIHGGMPPRLAARGVSLDTINQLTRQTLDHRSYQIAFDEDLRSFYGESDEGPFWYRGYHVAREGRYPHATVEDIDAILETYGSRAIVVGHTGVPQVMSLYDGKVFGIDMPLETLGSFQGLLWQNGRFYRVNGDGSRDRL